MFRNWSNIDSSNTRNNPPEDHIVSDAPTSTSPFARSDEIEDERLGGFNLSPRLNNATYLDPEKKFKEGERLFSMNQRERFELYNRGNHNGKWTIDQTVKYDGDDWNFCRALTSQMGLSERGRILTWRILKQADMRTYRSIEPAESEETIKQFLVAFCIGALVYNRIHREYEWTDDDWQYYPGTTTSKKMERYLGPQYRRDAEQQGDHNDRHRTIERCAESLGFSEADIRSCMEKVRTRIPSWATPT